MGRPPDFHRAIIPQGCRAFMEEFIPLIRTACGFADRRLPHTVSMTRIISARVAPRPLAIPHTTIAGIASAIPAVSHSVSAMIPCTARASLAGIGTARDTAVYTAGTESDTAVGTEESPNRFGHTRSAAPDLSTKSTGIPAATMKSVFG